MPTQESIRLNQSLVDALEAAFRDAVNLQAHFSTDCPDCPVTVKIEDLMFAAGSTVTSLVMVHFRSDVGGSSVGRWLPHEIELAVEAGHLANALTAHGFVIYPPVVFADGWRPKVGGAEASGSRIWAIVGGAVGAAVGVCLVVGLVMWRRRRHARIRWGWPLLRVCGGLTSRPRA